MISESLFLVKCKEQTFSFNFQELFRSSYHKMFNVTCKWPKSRDAEEISKMPMRPYILFIFQSKIMLKLICSLSLQ